MLEQRELRLGFVALSDAAPLVIAKERGFFRRHGLAVTLERQPSWANVRDKVVHGLLDGAQMLAPMPLAATLGLEGVAAPMLVPLALCLGGNAVTVSAALAAELAARGLAPDDGALAAGAALGERIADGRRRGAPPLRFGVVHPFSSHYYQLCYWLAAAGIDPTRDLALSVIPPASMVRALERGEIDGYVVGEPWSQLAVDRGVGVPLVASGDIWQSAPEKVFATSEEWAERHPATLRALVRALLEACRWLDHAEHRLEAAHVIAGESFVDAPVAAVAASLSRGPAGGAPPRRAETSHRFFRHAANLPWVSHAAWFLTQMLRWGQLEKPLAIGALARRVYRPALCRDAAEELGLPFPELDEKVEGAHERDWLLEGRCGALELGPDRFLDGRVFRAEQPVAYLESFEHSALRVRLDDLALLNP